MGGSLRGGGCRIVPGGKLADLFSMVFSVFFFRLFLEGSFSSFFAVLGGFEGPKGGNFWHISC